MVLAVVAAAIGAGAALWLRESAPSQPATTLEPVSEVREAVEEAQEPAPEPQTSAEPRRAPQAQQAVARVDTPVASPDDEAEPSEEEEQGPPVEPIRDTASDAEPPRESESQDSPISTAEPVVAVAPAELTVSPPSVRQGETVVLTVSAANRDGTTAAIVRSSRGRWPPVNLTSFGDQSWGILGVPRDTEVGFYAITVDLHDAGGRWLQTLTGGLTVRASEAALEEIWLEGGTGEVNQEAVQRDHDVRFVEHTEVSGPPLWRGAWLRPAVGEDSGYFGALRMYNGVMGDQWHHGHDIAANHGDWIVAPARGVVVWTGELALHGIGVILDHGAGVYSGYWHMSLIAVSIGMEVELGDWLGNIGSTGLSTGPHLHWEVIIRGVDVDPLQWLGEERPPLPVVLAAPEAAEEETETPSEAIGADG